MRFGWCTWEAKLTETNAIGDDHNSIGFDTLSNRVLFDSNIFEEYTNSTPKLSDWRVGDVIGCLIDIHTKLFVFYINGREVKCYLMDQFRTITFYATASLTANQKCYFNFGQESFRYPPKRVGPWSQNRIEYRTFHHAARNEIDRYRLIEPSNVGVHYWFAHIITEHIEDKFYCDDRQNKYDKVVKKLVEDENEDADLNIYLSLTALLLAEITESYFYYYVNIEYDSIEYFRYIQALIEMTGNQLKADNIIYFVQYIENHIKTIEYISEAQFCEFISAYIRLSTSEENIAKHRNICIVLQIVIRYCKNHTFNYVKHIKQDILNYLIKTFCNTNDKWTRLFTLLGLEALELTDDEKESIIVLINEKIIQLRNEWMLVEQFGTFDWITSENDCDYTIKLDYQLYFCYEWFLQNMQNTISSEDIPTSSSTVEQVKLNPAFASAQIKLSSDFLSARSDWNWQSVRSVCETGDDETFYYEALLLTSGPMRIGWTTRLTELAKSEIGDDEYSIGFDGYGNRVWHEGRKYLAFEFFDSTKWTAQNLDKFSIWTLGCQKMETRWKAGDIVGCLIDTTSQKKFNFFFYLNGRLLYYEANTFFSHNPYHAAVSLSSHQQCFLNLGQSPFKYPPNRADYTDFYKYYQQKQQQLQSANSNGPVINVNQSNNVVVTAHSTFTAGDIGNIGTT